MDKDILEIIRDKLKEIPDIQDAIPPVHAPEMPLIGCVDARLNIVSDVGIPYGKAIIHRNIAALVRSKPDMSDSAGFSVAASLEFAINVMHVKHIVVMGHTDCGGIRACLEDSHTHDTQSLRKYLSSLSRMREDVVAQGGDITAQAREMEKAAVRQSVTNLMSDEVVRQALDEGKLDIHGWIINTATKKISELDLETGEFR